MTNEMINRRSLTAADLQALEDKIFSREPIFIYPRGLSDDLIELCRRAFPGVQLIEDRPIRWWNDLSPAGEGKRNPGGDREKADPRDTQDGNRTTVARENEGVRS